MPQADNNRLTVSVIIPTYNRAAYIAGAIESALCQTRPPDEILIVDDGSTDDTPSILAQFGPPVRVIRQENRGRSAARNACLRAATCDVVVFLDSDDRLEPECVELFATELERDADVCVAYGNAYFCDASGNRLGLYTELLPGPRPSGMVLRELTRRNFLMMASMVRRRCLEAISFDEEMECAEDYDFWRRVAVHCKFCYVNRPIVNYQLHDAGTVTTRLRETMAGEAEVQRRIMAMPEFNNLSRREQARAFSIHGMKLAMLGEIADARKFFRRAIATSPTRVSSYTLLLLSLGGTRVMQSAILLRRRLVGNRLGTKFGPVQLLRSHDSTLRTIGQFGVPSPAGEAS